MSSSMNEPTLDEIVAFLSGEQPLDGIWYGEHTELQPKYWWRKRLRSAVARADIEARIDELQYLDGFPKSAKTNPAQPIDIRIATLRNEPDKLGGQQ